MENHNYNHNHNTPPYSKLSIQSTTTTTSSSSSTSRPLCWTTNTSRPSCSSQNSTGTAESRTNSSLCWGEEDEGSRDKLRLIRAAGADERHPKVRAMSNGREVRQIPDPANTSPKTSTTGWLCEKCGNEGKRRRLRARKAKAYGRRRASSPPEIGPLQRGLPYCRNWQSLAQIVHLGRRKPAKRSVFTDSSQSSMEQRDEEEPGCKQAFCGKRMKEWAFWFIVAFLAGLTIKDLYNLVKEYTENPKKSDMNVRFNETMRMPNITFCMSRAQAWSHFRLNGTESGEEWEEQIAAQLANMTDREAFLKKPWEFGMVMETYNLISTLTSMERETSAHGTVNSIEKFRTQERLGEIRKLTKFWLAELKKRDVTFEEFLQKVGKETLRRSMQRFQRTTYDEDLVIKTQLTITWLSQWQLCFQPTFDEENLKPIEEQGQFFVMALSHNAEKLDGQQVDCMSADFHGRPSSSSRFMGSKSVSKDGFTDELCLGMMHETTVEVKARYKMLPNDDEGTACADNEDEEGEDNEWNCYLRCRMEFIRELCNCTAPTLSYLARGGAEELEQWPVCDYAQCEVDSQGKNYSDDECTKKCKRNCDQIRFNIDHERKGKSVRPDFTTVVLKWGSFEYLTLEQDWVWSATTFIAAIGGSIGMWLGLSILSLIQGSTYLITYVEHKVVEKRKQRSVSITEEAPPPSKSSKVHPKLSKIHLEEEDKLAANPFASPFKKLSHAAAPPPVEE